MLKSLCLGVAVLLGVAMMANGIFTLVSAGDWYLAAPGTTSTEAFNQHFLRDIGLILWLRGGAYLAGAAVPQLRVLLWATAFIWLLGHALFHLWQEVVVGICSPLVIPRDFPAVSLLAIIAALQTLWAIQQSRGRGGKAV